MMRSVSPAATAQLAAWHSRRPSFALMGEYSSGKSALLNVLLGYRLLPTKVTATDLPAIWITKGTRDKLLALAHDGSVHDLTIDDLTSGKAMDYLAIRIEAEAEILSRTDIIDTPGISDPRMSTAIVAEIAGFSDFVIWCSPANQAWRQTERAFWKSMPEMLQKHSILALTRADKMRSAEDLDKVLHRCGSEAGGQFATVLSMSTPLAMAAREATDAGDVAVKWAASGADRLMRHIDRAVDAAVIACATRADVKDPASARPNRPKTAEKGSKPQPRIAKDPLNLSEVAATLIGLRNDALDSANNERVMATIGHLLIKVFEYKQLTEAHQKVLCRSLAVDTAFKVNVPRVVEQIGHEIEDFAEEAWCELGV